MTAGAGRRGHGPIRGACPGITAELTRLAPEVFGSLTRSDQRRWARVYVAGLLAGRGRPSARRLSEGEHAGRADQALQQFVGSSPWDPGPVRRSLAEALPALRRPSALVTVEVSFPKDGRLSPGVERQYAHDLGKVANCQRALAVVLADDRRGLPVEWTLMLPRAWDADHHRRARARVPPGERSRPAWRHAVAAVDSVAEWTGVAPAPVVSGAALPRDALALGAELDERGHPHVTEVPATLPVRHSGDPVLPLGRLVAESGAADRRRTVLWTGPGGRPSRSQFVALKAGPAGGGAPDADPDRHVVLADWPHSSPEPRSYWLSNMADRSLEDLVALSRMRDVARRAVTEMVDGVGLRGYEGRSHPGWHHHVTLASVAYGVALAHDASCVEASCAGLRM